MACRRVGGLGGVGRILCPLLRVEATRAGKGLLRGDHGVERTERSELVVLGTKAAASAYASCSRQSLELARTVRHAQCNRMTEHLQGVRGPRQVDPA